MTNVEPIISIGARRGNIMSLFTKENAKEKGRLGGLKGGPVGGKIGGLVSSEAKTMANRKKAQAAAQAGLISGRPIKTDIQCTCGKSVHVSKCRVYKTEKMRESRERRRAAGLDIPSPKDYAPIYDVVNGIDPDSYVRSDAELRQAAIESGKKHKPLTDLSWVQDGLKPRRPENVGKPKRPRKSEVILVE